MSYRGLRQALLAKLNVTPQRLSQRVQDIKRLLPMSAEEATCILAHQEGLDLTRYLGEEKLSRIRQLIADLPTPAPSGPGSAAPTKRRPSKAPKAIQITIARDIKVSDPVLPKRIIEEAKLMAERVYPLLYIFENSVREVIQQVMNRTLGAQWWSAGVPKQIAANVAKRMSKEKRNAWHGKRAAHPIYYADMGHLKQIVTLHWEHFAPLFPDEAWFTSRFDAIAFSRNVVDHHNPLANDDIKGLEVYTSQWHKQIRDCVARGLLDRPGTPQP